MFYLMQTLRLYCYLWGKRVLALSTSIGRVLFQAVPDPVRFTVPFALIGPVTVQFAVPFDKIASRSVQKSGTKGN